MLRALWLNVATLLLQMNECLALRRRRIASTDEVVADLYTYLEQMTQKCAELEVKVKRCNQRALVHKQRASQDPTRLGKEREINRAKMYLKDKRRLLDDQDRTLRFMHLIRHQIDSITTSQMDNIMVDAMLQYNMTAKRMGFPDKSREIETLSKEVQERFEEVNQLQSLLSEASNPSALFLVDIEEEDLLLELDALDQGQDTTTTIITTSTAQSSGELRQRPVAEQTADGAAEEEAEADRKDVLLVSL